jgi:hypothetical protein
MRDDQKDEMIIIDARSGIKTEKCIFEPINFADERLGVSSDE